MDVAEFRRAFSAFLGADGFAKFVKQLHRAGRLRYWQEGDWSEFIAARPEFLCSDEELRRALRICELHGSELQIEAVKVICDNYWDHSPSYDEQRIRLFPNSAKGPVMGGESGRPNERRTMPVWFCAECRAAEAAWHDRHA